MAADLQKILNDPGFWQNQSTAPTPIGVMKSMRGIHIEECANGWIVKVGCQMFVYDDLDSLLIDFEFYLRDPENTEREILAEAQNYQRRMNSEGKAKQIEMDRYLRDAYNQCSQGPETACDSPVQQSSMRRE